MDSFSSEREKANWTKGATGLTVTKIGLSQFITKTWKNHLNSWDTEEKKHLPEFFKNVEEGNIKYECKNGQKKGRKVLTIESKCQPCMCKKILDRLLKLHVNPNPKNIVWNPFKKPKDDHVLSKLTQYTTISRQPYFGFFSEVCPICKLIDCPFERHRKGISLFKDEDNNVDNYYWKIANMFMFRGKERNSIVNTGPEDTDSALIFKMMKNCTLFTLGERGKRDSDDNNDEEDESDEDEADSEIYDELLEVRNFLMHTPDNCLSDENLKECFKQMKTILRADKFQDDWSKKAVKELSRLQKKTLIMSMLSSEETSLVKLAYAEQKSALEYDINFTGKLQSDRVLKDILKGVMEKCKDYPDPVQISDRRETPRQSSGGAATAGGATTGAIIGSVAGPPGAILGAAIGGAFGWFAGKEN